MFNSPPTPSPLLNFPNPNLLSHPGLSLNAPNNSNAHSSSSSPPLFPPNFHNLHFPSQPPSSLPPFQLPDFSSSSASSSSSSALGSGSPVGAFSPHNVLSSLPPNILRSLPPNVLAQIAQIDGNHSFSSSNSNSSSSGGHSSVNIPAAQSHSSHSAIGGIMSPVLSASDFSSRLLPNSSSGEDHASKRQRMSNDFFGNLSSGSSPHLGLSSLLGMNAPNLSASIFNSAAGSSASTSTSVSSSMAAASSLSSSPPVNLRNQSLLMSSNDLNDEDSDDGSSGEKPSGSGSTGRRKGGSNSADNDKDGVPDAKAKHRAVDARRRKREAEAFRILHDLTFPAAVQASGGASVLSSDRVSVLNRASDMIRSISEIRKNGEERLSSALRALENAKREKDVLEQELIILRQQLAIIDRERMHGGSKAQKSADESQDDEVSLIKRDSQRKTDTSHSAGDSIISMTEGNDLVRALRASGEAAAGASALASASGSASASASQSSLAPQSNSLIYRALHVLMNTWQQERRKYESRALHSSVFLDSTLSIIVTDMSGRVVDANRTVCQRLRFSREQLTGKYLSAIHAHVHLANPIFLTFLPNFMKTTRANPASAHDEKSTAHNESNARRADDANSASNTATPTVTLFPSPASLASFVHLNANDVPHSTIGSSDNSSEAQKDALSILSLSTNSSSSSNSASHANSSSPSVVSASSAAKVAAYYEKSAPSLLSIRKLISLYSGASSVVLIEFKTIDAAYRLMSSLMRVWLVQDVTHGKPIYQVHCGIDANDDFKFESEFDAAKIDDPAATSPAHADSDGAARRHT